MNNVTNMLKFINIKGISGTYTFVIHEISDI